MTELSLVFEPEAVVCPVDRARFSAKSISRVIRKMTACTTAYSYPLEGDTAVRNAVQISEGLTKV